MVKRTYRIDRMVDVTVLDEPAVESLYSLGIDPALVSSGAFDMFIDGLPTMVELEFTEDISKYVVERFGDVVSPVDEDLCRAHVRVWPSPWFYAWAFLFDGKMRIARPESIVKEYKEMLKRASEKSWETR